MLEVSVCLSIDMKKKAMFLFCVRLLVVLSLVRENFAVLFTWKKKGFLFAQLA
jgi:hypothetical protein